MDGRLAVVTVRELIREPAAVLDRVTRGERLIVARYGRPVATLQPLDGVVVQPLTQRECDIAGSPLGDVEAELAKLSDLERRLLAEAGKWDRIQPMRVVAHCGPGEPGRALDRLALRGLAKKRLGGGSTRAEAWSFARYCCAGREAVRGRTGGFTAGNCLCTKETRSISTAPPRDRGAIRQRDSGTTATPTSSTLAAGSKRPCTSKRATAG